MNILTQEDRHEVAKRPFKICMHDLETARTDVRVMREATALAAAGYDVTIVDAEVDASRPWEEDFRGVYLKHIKSPGWFLSTRFKPWFLVKAAMMLFRGVFHLIRVPADVYHAHDVTGLPACYIVARLRRKPLIYDAHEMPLSERNVTRWQLLHAIATRVFACMIPYCSGVITVSPPIAEEIQRRYGGPEVTLVRNVPVCRDVAKNNRLRQKLGLKPETRIALYQGVLNPDRALDLLVCAARFLDQNIVIVMLGNGPKEVIVSLNALIESEEVADRVKMLPAVPYEELLDWTASADIGLNLLPPDYSFSIQMCLPNKFFEYMMAGLPVLSSQLEVVASMIKTYDVGQVVSPLTPTNIATGINSILADRAALERMSANALQAIRQELNWEKEQQQLIDLYRSVLAGKRVCMHVLKEARTDTRIIHAIKALAEVDYAVSIIDVADQSDLPAEETVYGARIQHILMPDWRTSRRSELQFFIRAVQVFFLSILRLLNTPADIYHARELTALPACFVAATLRRKPLIFEVYDLQFPVPDTAVGFWRKANWLILKLHELLLPRCTAVIVTSPFHAEELRKRFHLKEVTLVRSIPAYHSATKRNLLKQRLCLSPEIRIALFQGTIQADRELDRLVRAAKYLSEGNVIVMMGNAEGTLQTDLEALIEKEGVSDRVKIIPPVPYEELLDWTASADLGLIIYSPAYSLNIRTHLPNKLFEYLMVGLPVLSTQLDAVVDVIQTYDVGQVAASLDPLEIAEAINTMLADQTALERMRRNALAAARSDLHWDKEKQQLIDLYRKILGDSDNTTEEEMGGSSTGEVQKPGAIELQL